MAIATAAIPSPRPIGPSRSFVVALMLTSDSLTPIAAAMFLSHRGHVRCDLWRFSDYGCINIEDARVFLGEQFSNTLQNFDAADAPNRFVGVWKMLSDVAGADRAEQRIGNRMRQNIGVGMSLEPAACANLDAAQDQFQSLGESDGCRNRCRSGS